jgi:hypothetical protein
MVWSRNRYRFVGFERGREKRGIWGWWLPWESVKKIEREKTDFDCVVNFFVLVAKCLRGKSGLESFIPHPY